MCSLHADQIIPFSPHFHCSLLQLQTRKQWICVEVKSSLPCFLFILSKLRTNLGLTWRLLLVLAETVTKYTFCWIILKSKMKSHFFALTPPTLVFHPTLNFIKVCLHNVVKMFLPFISMNICIPKHVQAKVVWKLACFLKRNY